MVARSRAAKQRRIVRKKTWLNKSRQGLIGIFKPEDGPDWQKRNRQLWLEKQRVGVNAGRKRVFLEAIAYYGQSKCFCCGEREPMFLALDHIYGGGNQHRAEVGGHMAEWAKKNNWPPIFRVACHNCNAGMAKNSGTCPHQVK